jgi:integrase
MKRVEDGLYMKGDRYFVRKRISKIDIYQYLGPVSRSDARMVRDKLISQAVTGKYDTANSASGYTVGDMLSDYWVEHLFHLKSAETGKYALDRLDDRLGNFAVLNLKRTDIEEYKRLRLHDYRKQDRWLVILPRAERPREPKTVSKRTVQSEIKYLSMAAQHAYDNERLPHNGISRFCNLMLDEPAKHVLDEGFPDGPEWQALYSCANVEIKLLLLWLYETGMRLGEAQAARWEWLQELQSGFWIINIDMDNAGKKRHRRAVPVSATLRDALLPATRQGLIFGTASHYKTFRRAANKAGLPRTITFNALRRTRASIGDAIDDTACRVMLGHAPADIHDKHYAPVTIDRMFRLVGLDYGRKLHLSGNSL